MSCQHGGRGVVVAGVAAQLELGQLRPDVFQGAPGLPRRPDLGVVVRGAGLQAGQRERGRGIAGAAWRELAARVVAVDRVQVVVPVLEAHQLAADQPGQDGRGVGGGVDRPEQEVDPDRRDRRGVDRQGLHHLLRGRVQQLVGLPDQHLDHLVFGQVAGAVEQVARGEGVIAVQDRLDRLQRPREPAGVPAQPVEQLLGGIAQPEAAVVVQRPQDGLGVRGAQALLQPQLALPGRLDLQQRGRRHPGGGDHRDRVRGRGQHRAQRLVQRLLGEGFPLGVHHRFQVVQQHHHRLPGREGLQQGQHHLRRGVVRVLVQALQPLRRIRRQQPQQVRDQGRVLHLMHAVAAQVHDPAHRDRRRGRLPRPGSGRPPGP